MSSKEAITKCIQNIKGDYFTETENLVSGGWLDSFEIIRLIHGLEKAFDVKIPVSELSPDSFDSVGSVSEVLEKCGVKIDD